MEVRVERADVAPVALLTIVLIGDHVLREVIRSRHAGVGECGDDVATQIGVLVLTRRDHVDQRLRVENVIAHAGQTHLVVAGHGRGVGDLLVERNDPAVVGDLDHAELGRFVLRHRNGRDRDASAALVVLVDHLTRVHPIDVIGTEHGDDVGRLVVDEVEVLVDGVGGALEPVRPATHLGRYRCDVVVEHRREPPGLGDVAVEAVALVLGEHDDLQVAGIGEIRQREVDQSVRAGERNGRLGAVIGQRLETLAFAAGQHDHEHFRFDRHHRPPYTRATSPER